MVIKLKDDLIQLLLRTTKIVLIAGPKIEFDNNNRAQMIVTNA